MRERERALSQSRTPATSGGLFKNPALRLRLFSFVCFFVSVHCKDCFMTWYSFYLVSDLNVPQMIPQVTCRPNPTVTCLAGFIVGSVGEPLTDAVV